MAKETDTMIVTEYNEFLEKNRIKVNKYLNTVLWSFVLTGPAIALGIKTGAFPDIRYITCINISVAIMIMSTLHFFMVRENPSATVTCMFALTSLNLLISYMAFSHIAIKITWFLVPMLSVLFCDRVIFFYSFIINYILIVVTTKISITEEVAQALGFDSTSAYFGDIIGGFTIESIIMFAGAYYIGKLTTDYFKDLFEQYKVIKNQDREMEEKVGLLDSMAEIYDKVNLIDFVNNTEMSLRDSEQKKHGIDMHTQTHSIINQEMTNQVMPDQLDEFLVFTNIKTVRSRLSNKKIVTADFIDVISGWFRAQYITVDSTVDGIPNKVIFTTRNVDEEKRREEHLIRISMTDEMTRLFNRRCYDEDLREIRSAALDDDFVIFSVDVNGLKTANDTKGHAAGDELIKGAANCLALSTGHLGKVYRTGGDEFIIVAHTMDPEALRKSIKENADNWHGKYVNEVTMSIGYAAHLKNPDATIDDLEHIADADMYAEKEKFYKERGIKRRQ